MRHGQSAGKDKVDSSIILRCTISAEVQTSMGKHRYWGIKLYWWSTFARTLLEKRIPYIVLRHFMQCWEKCSTSLSARWTTGEDDHIRISSRDMEVTQPGMVSLLGNGSVRILASEVPHDSHRPNSRPNPILVLTHLGSVSLLRIALWDDFVGMIMWRFVGDSNLQESF